MTTPVSDILSQPVFVTGSNVPFGDMSLEQVHGRADELRAATGWGPTARVAPVATAWAELAGVMRQTGAGQVRELAPDVVTRLAPRLWVVLPGGAG